MYPNNFSISAIIVAFEDEKKFEKIVFSHFWENWVKISRLIINEMYEFS